SVPPHTALLHPSDAGSFRAGVIPAVAHRLGTISAPLSFYRPRDDHPSRPLNTQEISIKRPSRGTPASVPTELPRPSGLILPEEPDEAPTASTPSDSAEGDADEPSAGNGAGARSAARR